MAGELTLRAQPSMRQLDANSALSRSIAPLQSPQFDWRTNAKSGYQSERLGAIPQRQSATCGSKSQLRMPAEPATCASEVSVVTRASSRERMASESTKASPR